MTTLIRSFGSFLQKSTNILCNNSLAIAPLAPHLIPTWMTIAVRTNIRNKFPRAKEGKRVKINGWNARMSTNNGRKIIMRRFLKGNHVLSH